MPATNDGHSPDRSRLGNGIREEGLRRTGDIFLKAALLENLPDMVLVHNLHGFFVYVNNAALETLGYTAEEIPGIHIGQVDRNAVKISHVVDALQKHGQCRFTTVLTAKDGREITVEVFSRFVSDWCDQIIVSVARDISRRVEAQEKLKLRHRRLIAQNNQLRLKSEKDPLTDLYNRLFFERALNRMEGNRDYYPVSIFLLDVDGLKLVNDILGHSKGDVFLKKAVSLIKASFRSQDIIARLGGDEFAVLMPRSPRQVAGEKAVALRRMALASLEEPLPVSFSVGFASTENIFKSLHDVLREADAEMYRAKQANRATICSAVSRSLWRLRNEGYHDF